MSTDRQSERERRRAQETCGTFEQSKAPVCPRPEQLSRRPAPCEDPPECAPDQGLAPEALPEFAIREYGYPAALVLTSAVPSVSCADLDGQPPKGGLTGDLDDIAISEEFDWSEIEDITDNQLDYISGLSEDELDVVRTGTPSEIRSVTRLRLDQSTFVRDRLDAIQLALDTSARTAALTLLDCWWDNELKVDVCLDDDGQPIPETLVEVPAGSVKSYFSQADADDQAIALAASLLQCPEPSYTVTVTCEELGYDGGNVTSATATARTEAEAREQALSVLDCYYKSLPVRVTCDATEGMVAQEGTADDDWPELIETNGGSLPYGWATSQISSRDATDLALNFLTASVVCEYLSPERVVTCPNQAWTDRVTSEVKSAAPSWQPTSFMGLSEPYWSDNKLDPTAQQTVNGYKFTPQSMTVVIPAGMFKSATSQTEADAQADAAEELVRYSLLQCAYCNEAVPVSCGTKAEVEDTYTDQQGVVTTTVDTYWSVDKTAGMVAGILCGPDMDEVMTLASQLATVPVAKTDGTKPYCTYRIPGGTGRCVPPLVPPATDKWNTPADVYVYEGEDAAALRGRLLKESPCVLTDLFVDVASDADPNAIVDQKVGEMEEALRACVTCEFGNRQVTLGCDYAAIGDFFNEAALRDIVMKSGDDSTLELGIIPNPVEDDGSMMIAAFTAVVPAGRFKSEDPWQADIDAVYYAQTILRCQYSNPKLKVYCGAQDAPMETLIAAAKDPGRNVHPDYQQDGFGDPSFITDDPDTQDWGDQVALPGGGQVDDTSAGSPYNPVEVDAGKYTAEYGEGTYDDVLKQAIEDGLDQLDCYKSNGRMDLKCEDYAFAGIEETNDDDENDPGIRFDPSSNTADNPIVLPPGMFKSTTSAEDLQAQIDEYANSVLRCKYTNLAVTASDCDEGDVPLSLPTVPPGTVTGADSPADAKSQAQNMADAMRVCADPDQLGGGGGGRGNDGQQKDCQGPCFGYYS